MTVGNNHNGGTDSGNIDRSEPSAFDALKASVRSMR